MKFHHSVCMGILGALLTAGCGASSVPVHRVASTEAAIRSAKESGATNTPRAALHLHYAEMQRTQAQRFARERQRERADLLLRRAEADANLSLALTRQAVAEREAQSAADGLQSLPKR